MNDEDMIKVITEDSSGVTYGTGAAACWAAGTLYSHRKFDPLRDLNAIHVVVSRLKDTAIEEGYLIELRNECRHRSIAFADARQCSVAYVKAIGKWDIAVSKGDWHPERSSGHDGFRCISCCTWVYADAQRTCKCDIKDETFKVSDIIKHIKKNPGCIEVLYSPEDRDQIDESVLFNPDDWKRDEDDGMGYKYYENWSDKIKWADGIRACWDTGELTFEET